MKRLLLLIALLATPLLADRAAAQVALIPYLGYNLSAGLDPEAEDEDDRAGAFLVGIGAEFGLPLQAPVAIKIRPSVEYMFLPGAKETEDDFSFEYSQSRLQVNGDVIAEFGGGGAVAPYAGAGVAWSSYNMEAKGCFDDECESEDDSESGIGFNVLGGVRLASLGFGAPFVQARYTILTIDPEGPGDVELNGISIMGGLVIPLGAQ